RFLPPGPPRGTPAPAANANNDCMSGMANFNLSMVTARRFPVADEESGIALGLAVFIRRPGSPTPRNVFSEWFVVDEGKIRYLWTAMFYPAPTPPVPHGPPYDGSWPRARQLVPPRATPPAGRQ